MRKVEAQRELRPRVTLAAGAGFEPGVEVSRTPICQLIEAVASQRTPVELVVEWMGVQALRPPTKLYGSLNRHQF